MTIIVLTIDSISLVNWISDTCSQGCTDLKSLLKRLDHRESDTICSHARLCKAVRRIARHWNIYCRSDAVFTDMGSKVTD